MSNSSIWHIDRTLSSATTAGHSGPGSNDNEGILYIAKSSNITEALPSNCLASYAGHSLEDGFYLSVEMQSVYSTAPQYRPVCTDTDNGRYVLIVQMTISTYQPFVL